jgi:phage regulator Rha-like protein
MSSKDLILSNDIIKSKIHTIRGKQVILDRDLAEWYGVETKQLKRNKKRFPKEFCFQLSEKEFSLINIQNLRCQNGTSSLSHGGTRYISYVFTEQGVTMLSALLKSDKAIEMSIKIIKAFVAMRHFLIQNANIFQKFQQIDQQFIEYDSNFNKIFKAIESKQLTPKQDIFFDGQIFEAYKFVVDLIKQAKKEIILIDNFIDESVLTLLSNKNKDVSITIYTAKVSDALVLAEKKFNKQYNNLEIKEFTKSHDRFLIIDNQTYHIGASLKDLGKKWFAFNKMNIDILDKLN